MIDLKLASSTWDDKEVDAMMNVISSSEFTMGKKVQEFEKEFASVIGTKYALMVNSGSSANLILVAGLKYMANSKLEEGDEFLVPSISWSTTFYPIQQMGFKLRFVDVDKSTLNIDFDKIEDAITEKTRGIFAVNLLGNPCDFQKIEELASKHNLLLLEDNCESLGAEILSKKTGSFGIGGTHSFFYSHHICTMEGGMVTTDNKVLLETMISLRAHGWLRGLDSQNSVSPLSDSNWDNLFKFVLPGYNLRPLELQAAVGLEQIKKLPEFVDARRKNARTFQEYFGSIPNISIQNECGSSSWFGFAIILNDKLLGKRKIVLDKLHELKVETRPIVAGNFLKNPVIKHLPHSTYGGFETADHIDQNGFFIGNHHYDIRNELMAIAEVLRQFTD